MARHSGKGTGRTHASVRLGERGGLGVHVPVPLAPALVYVTVRGAVRHWRWTGPVAVLLGLRVWLGSWLTVGVAVCGATAIGYGTWLAWHQRRAAGDLAGLLRGRRRKRDAQRGWTKAAARANLSGNGKDGAVPTQRRVRYHPDGTVTAHVNIGAHGGKVSDLRGEAERLADAAGARAVEIHRGKRPGTARIEYRFADAPLVRERAFLVLGLSGQGKRG